MFSLLCLKKLKNAMQVRNRSKSVFTQSLKRNLLFINSVTSGGCMAVGDLIQQEIEYQSKMLSKRYDWARIVRMFTVGVCLGPMHHYYYLYLDKLLPRVDMKTTAKKVLCDQAIASPATILGFFYMLGILENKSISESTAEIKHKFKYVYMGDCLYWPPVQVINFHYLPTEYRVIYINAATMIFNIFLSFMKHYDQH